MKLLFDENLSPDLPRALADCFPGSIHVSDVGLSSEPDEEVWKFAERENLAIVTKDADFRQRSFLFGPRPKVVWVGVGNCSTHVIEQLLRTRSGEIKYFLQSESAAFLVLRRGD